MVPTGFHHSFSGEIYKRRVTPAVVLVRAAYAGASGGSKDHNWLVHTGRRHSFGNEDNKQQVPIGCLLSFVIENDEQLVPSSVSIA